MPVFGILAVSTLLKLALIPSYKSTDFEGTGKSALFSHSFSSPELDGNHAFFANFTMDVSEWTLDYPPFFAYFEWILSQLASYIDPKMLIVENLNYSSQETIYFQRLSVIMTEMLLFYALNQCLKHLATIINPRHAHFIIASLAFNPALLFVDHMHFQYNGFMYGIQLFSLSLFAQKRYVLGGIFFAILINFKHIYLYQALPFFIYILSAYCFPNGFNPKKFIMIAASTVLVFAFSLAPFSTHLPQLFSRMFPFKRGICHSYWAGNVWALYSFADRVLTKLLPSLNYPLTATSSLTRGIVGDSIFNVLPQITPPITFALTFLTQIPPLYTLFRKPSFKNFLNALVLSSFSAYMLGWHVHEKAILMIMIPMSLSSLNSIRHARLFVFICTIGGFSLFPLLFGREELLIKACLLWAWYQGCMLACKHVFKNFEMTRFQILYLAFLVPLFVSGEIVYPVAKWYAKRINDVVVSGYVEKMEFLPLLATSVYTALGMVYAWAEFWNITLKDDHERKEKGE